jgi:bacillithiol system protein YtxJ
MNWQLLTNEQELQAIIKNSVTHPQVIFKHSTRCSISSVAKNRLEKSAAPAGIHFHLLDLLLYRTISNKIAEQLQVQHQSPQVLLIKNGECVYDESHSSIYMDEIIEQCNAV